MAKILVLGGTGAFGIHLVPELLRRGHEVDVVSLDDMTSSNGHLHYEKGDATQLPYLKELLARHYDGVVDFMIYHKSVFEERYRLFLENTSHYIFLSTYRIYAGEHPITEASPRLLEAFQDPEYQSHAEDEYSLYKAYEEDMLRASGRRNFTILRPSISYSTGRYQLVTLEARELLHRTREGRPIVLPEEAMDKEATMTWAGDSAKMMASLLLNEKAFGQTYTISTAEHHPWKEVAGYYADLIGLRYVTVDTETYMKIWADNSILAWYQLKLDRLFDRVVDNSKILAISGLKQEELMPLKKGLQLELEALGDKEKKIRINEAYDERADAYLKTIGY